VPCCSSPERSALNQLAMRHRSGLSWSLAALLVTRALGAEPRPSTIILTFDASSEAQKQAITAIRAHVSGLPAEVVIVPAEHQRTLDSRLAAAGSLAASRQALGTFHIEIERDGTLLIFFTEAGAEATLIRRLPPNHQGVRVALEQAAIVVRSLVEALLEGGSVGIAPAADRVESEGNAEPSAVVDSSPERSSAASALPDPEEPPSRSGSQASPEAPSVRPRIAITAGYTATDFASVMPWQSGFSAGFQWLATPVVYAGARYTFFPTYTATTKDAVVAVARRPIEALVGYRAASPLGLNGEVGLLADGARRTTVSTAESLRPTSPSTRWMVSLAARAGLSWSPWSRIRASLRGGADFVLTPYAYKIDSALAAPSPHWVRPRMELELAADLW
jgi:hypothetical protein